MIHNKVYASFGSSGVVKLHAAYTTHSYVCVFCKNVTAYQFYIFKAMHY